jgi:hypothetical protein
MTATVAQDPVRRAIINAYWPTLGGDTMAEDDFHVPFGQLTFDAEGMETPGPYFSRKAHVPGPWSGVTIGRGYDMGQHSAAAIIADLTAAGVPRELAERFAPAAGLKGNAARRFIRSAGLTDAEITPAQQKALFIATYDTLAQDCMRICRKPDVVATYGPTVWEALEPRLRDVVVDLRYRGDYTPKTRKRVQPLIVANDLTGMRDALADEPYWCGQFGVPRDRFERRRDYLAGG